MSDIVIHHPHNKPHDEARSLAEQVAAKLKAEFGLDYHWQGDVLEFQRSGVSGQLKVAPAEVMVVVKLGFLLSALKPKISSEIHRFLAEKFG
ncbi:polyhydroxyalkanoic acid system family protein [Chitinimonas lacunae]|uniref:Polyhydroxyalkanoic acid system family protein n=1 Tax=Chitinimonas lacunae TaxID=1963018 RepID=A0ABV8MUS9_9NEIS